MNRRRRAVLQWGWLGLVGVELACGPSQQVAETPKATAVASAEPTSAAKESPVRTDKPLPVLASGDLPPVESGLTVVGRAVATDQSEGYQTLLVEVPVDGLPLELQRSIDNQLFARVVGAQRSSPAVLASGESNGLTSPSGQAAFRLWVRRPVPLTEAKVDADPETARRVAIEIYTAAGWREAALSEPDGKVPNRIEPGHHFRVEVTVPEKIGAQSKVFAAYLEALGRLDRDSPAAWFWDKARTVATSNDRWAKETLSREWGELMRFSTGYDSVEAALVTDRKLRAPVAPSAATVPMSALKGPELFRHEWGRMLAAVARVTPAEPLAAMVPAEFYYARARSFEAFQTLLDQVDEVVTPGLHIGEQRRQRLDLADRYRLELGLPADELARVLGPRLVHSLVLVGSDPMLRQGSDVSLILEVPVAETVLNVLAVKRAQLSQLRPLTESNWTHSGIAVVSHHSVDDTVRQELASFKRNDGKVFVLISNSKNAVKRILDTWTGQHPTIASELDFQYMLERDANVPDDVLIYFGDRFVAEAVGPRQRILDSRRQVAKAELMALSCGSLLFGQLYGRLPKDAKELGAKAWFGVNRLAHTSGEPIKYDARAGVSSPWGTPARLTSIIDLPVPQRVSKEEQAAYAEFADSYQGQWGERIDPIALRVKVGPEQLDAHLRVLPVMRGGDYEEVLRYSGGGLTTRVPSLPALAGILAIGAGSPLRELASGSGRSFLGNKFKLDWLGDWIEVGLADQAAVADFALKHGELPVPPSAQQPERAFREQDLATLPFYLALDVKSAAGAALFLTLVREMATGAAPDTVSWKEYGKRGETTIMQVSLEDINLYYALGKRRLLVALQVDILERLLAELETEGQRSPATGSRSGGQLVVDLSPQSGPGSLVRQSAFRTVASWLFEKGVHYTAIHDPWANLLLQGALDAPDAAAYERNALRWFGMVPVTADGKPYVLTDGGVADPERGSRHAPRWPRVPVSSGPVERVLEALVGLRAEVAVDDEPGDVGGERSLRAEVRLRVRGNQSAVGK